MTRPGGSHPARCQQGFRLVLEQPHATEASRPLRAARSAKKLSHHPLRLS